MKFTYNIQLAVEYDPGAGGHVDRTDTEDQLRYLLNDSIIRFVPKTKNPKMVYAKLTDVNIEFQEAEF